MKKFTFILITAFFLTAGYFSVFSQNNQPPYQLTTSLNTTYQPLANATVISDYLVWDDPSYAIPLGFDFEVFGETVDFITIGDGYCGLRKGADHSGFESFYYQSPFEIAVYGADLTDRNFEQSKSSASLISYQRDIVNGQTIFKVEWQNAGFYEEWYNTNATESYVNVQLWLYEGTNRIEIHVGDHKIVHPELNYYLAKGPYMYIAKYASPTEIEQLAAISGNGTKRHLHSLAGTLPWNAYTIAPGTVYAFSCGANTTTSAPDTPEVFDNVSVFPNPTSGKVNLQINNINTENIVVQVFRINGQLVYEQRLQAASIRSTINLTPYSEGMYFLRLQIGDDFRNYKIVVNR